MKVCHDGTGGWIMPITHDFEYVRPGTLSEAIGALRGAPGGAQVLAGGTDLVGWMRDELVAPRLIVDIKRIPGLADIFVRGDSLVVGALVTFTRLIECVVVRQHFPFIREMARAMASVGIRNRATLAGNICSAVPSCDGAPVLLAYEARVGVHGPNGARDVPITEWFLGPRKTALGPGEILTEIAIPQPAGGHGGCYVKLGRYRGEDLAQASVAVLALPERRYRVAFGAVAPTPVRARRIEALMNGRELSEALIAEARKLIPEETSPITDVRASREYRAQMLGVMFERGVHAAVERLAGGGPAYGTALI
jgi:CO/xanthine dehydrogenase FAD-binding subunit